MEIYPLTITMDRYGGTYSSGEYLAWRLHAWEVPPEPFMDDVTCMEFWETYKGIVGLGDTPETAVNHLERRFKEKAIELQREYGGSLSWWIEAVELCDDEISCREYVIRRGCMKV